MRPMTDRLTMTLAQLIPIVGDVAGNATKARAARKQAAADGADLVVFPELFIAGYPPEDLVLKPAFQAACRATIEELARETADGGPAMLIGTPWVDAGAEILVVPNGSPYHRDKDDVRLNIAVARVAESGLPLVYLNQIGGQDELVFDGGSFVLHADNSLAAQLPSFREDIATVRWVRDAARGWRCEGPITK